MKTWYIDVWVEDNLEKKQVAYYLGKASVKWIPILDKMSTQKYLLFKKKNRSKSTG